MSVTSESNDSISSIQSKKYIFKDDRNKVLPVTSNQTNRK